MFPVRVILKRFQSGRDEPCPGTISACDQPDAASARRALTALPTGLRVGDGVRDPAPGPGRVRGPPASSDRETAPQSGCRPTILRRRILTSAAEPFNAWAYRNISTRMLGSKSRTHPGDGDRAASLSVWTAYRLAHLNAARWPIVPPIADDIWRTHAGAIPRHVATDTRSDPLSAKNLHAFYGVGM